MIDSKRVLSIQSHVVHGYVGNKAATFPLQLLGWDVDAINTVQFSNHSGYRSHGGSQAGKAQLLEIIASLEKNEFIDFGALLTGYIPGAELLSVVADFAARLKMVNPNLIFLLDPVMGDDGKMYVANDVVPVYRDKLLPLATIITPNWYELELLTKIQVASQDSLRLALKILHTTLGVRHVVISSVIVRRDDKLLSELVQSGLTENLPFTNGTTDQQSSNELILCVSSSGTDNSDSPSIVHGLTVPRIPGYFSGVGDLFSALVLAHFDPTSDASTSTTPLSRAASRALHTTHSILEQTNQYAAETDTHTDDEKDEQNPLRRVRRMKARELRIVQSRDEILTGCAEREMKSWKGFWDE